MNSPLPYMSLFMNPEIIAQASLSAVKVGVIFILALYLVFSIIVVRQISLMTKTVNTSLTPTLKIIGYIHLAASVLVWLFALTM